MKKSFFFIAIVFVAVIAWQWFYEEEEPNYSSFHYKYQWQKEGITKDQWELRNVIDSAGLKTCVIGDTTLIIHYPDCLQQDSDSTGTGLMYMPTSKGPILMGSVVYLNTDGDSIDVVADKMVAKYEDEWEKVTMKDMHDGYFYLQMEDSLYILYQQFVMDDSLISCCGIMFPKYYQPSVKRLIDLVHQWNPR